MMKAIPTPAAPAPLTGDEQRWLTAYRRMAPHARAFLLAGAEGVANDVPRFTEPRLHLVAVAKG